MSGWLSNTIKSVGSWMGSGVASLFKWLLGGLISVVTKIIDAANGFWDVLESLWNFAVGFKDSVFGLFTSFFPFVPEPVMAVIGFGLLAVLIAGIVKIGRKE